MSKRNQQFNWHGDFIFHPKLKTELSTTSTDENLFSVSEYEENYYAQNDPSRYAIIRDGDLERIVNVSKMILIQPMADSEN